MTSPVSKMAQLHLAASQVEDTSIRPLALAFALLALALASKYFRVLALALASKSFCVQLQVDDLFAMEEDGGAVDAGAAEDDGAAAEDQHGGASAAEVSSNKTKTLYLA